MESRGRKIIEVHVNEEAVYKSRNWREEVRSVRSCVIGITSIRQGHGIASDRVSSELYFSAHLLTSDGRPWASGKFAQDMQKVPKRSFMGW